MKKLRLEMDDLRVESFGVRDDAPAEHGTVRGFATREGYPCVSNDYCEPSYDAPCWWTGDPMLDCYPISEMEPCTHYRC